MPEYWHSYRDNVVRDGDDPDTIKRKQFNQSIAASHKPYFMIYVYPQFKQRVESYIKNSNSNIRKRFVDYNIHNIEELREFEPKTDEMREFIKYYDDQKPYGNNNCVINRICRLYESEFPSFSALRAKADEFDYSILKSGVQYSRQSYDEIAILYQRYRNEVDSFYQQSQLSPSNVVDPKLQHEEFIKRFQMMASAICPNQYELCDILLDLCYRREGSKQFVWDVSGDIIIENLLNRNDHLLSFPSHSGNEFEYCGEHFSMKTIIVEDDNSNDYFK